MSAQQGAVKRIICISGDAASGKTTAAKGVQFRLPGWRIVSTGARFREYCAQQGIDPQQISFLGDDFHRAADDHMRRTLATERNIIAEARLVGYLARDMDDALRVFCECPLDVRAQRFMQREPGYTLDEARDRVASRDEADTQNFLRLYEIDYHDPSYYHLRVNTHTMNPDEVAEAILAAAVSGR
jgi:CMP/dCMP kinase